MTELYTVQKIIDKRINKKGVTEYKVKWLGYNEDQCTWEPHKNVKNVQYMIDEFQQSNNVYEKRYMAIRSGQKTMPQQSKRSLYYQENSYSEKLQEPHAQEIYEEQFNQQNNQDQNYNQNENRDENQNQNFDYLEQDQEGAGKEGEIDIGEDIDIQELNVEEQENDRKRDKNSRGQEQQLGQDYYYPKKVRKIDNKKTNSIRSAGTGKLQKNYPDEEQQTDPSSPLIESQRNIRFVVKNHQRKNKALPVNPPKPGQIKILEMALCNKTNEVIYLTECNDLATYRTRQFMIKNYPEEVIRYFQSKIQFVKIPKIGGTGPVPK